MDRPEYPLTVSFLDDGSSEICADAGQLAGALEYFDSAAPDETVRITDRQGRAVRVKVERLQVLVCELDADEPQETNPYAPPQARLEEEGEERAKASFFHVIAQVLAFLFWWSAIFLLLSPRILEIPKTVLAFWGFVGVYTFVLYRAKIITRTLERIFVGTVIGVFVLWLSSFY